MLGSRSNGQPDMTTIRLALLGYGSVGKAFIRLLQVKTDELTRRYELGWLITGVASRRLGWISDPAELEPAALGAHASAAPLAGWDAEGVHAWLESARPDVLVEMTSLNPHTGQPAIAYLRAALEHGIHAVTANKGPVVHGFAELEALARARGKRFLFESSVMDGAPIFSLFRETLPASRLVSFRGVLNSTTNFILTQMEDGRSFSDAVAEAQQIGIAETDPSADIDGWDAAVKVAALSRVLMGIPLEPDQIDRQGIRGLTGEAVRAARKDAQPFKLVCRAERDGEGIRASIRPERVPLSDPLASVHGTSSIVHFELDTLPGLTITEHNPGPETTAYGLLADIIRATKGSLTW